jgi:hypothetical protein
MTKHLERAKSEGTGGRVKSRRKGWSPKRSEGGPGEAKTHAPMHAIIAP